MPSVSNLQEGKAGHQPGLSLEGSQAWGVALPGCYLGAWLRSGCGRYWGKP